MANGITQSSLKYYKLFKLFPDRPLVAAALVSTVLHGLVFLMLRSFPLPRTLDESSLPPSVVKFQIHAKDTQEPASQSSSTKPKLKKTDRARTAKRKNPPPKPQTSSSSFSLPQTESSVAYRQLLPSSAELGSLAGQATESSTAAGLSSEGDLTSIREIAEFASALQESIALPLALKRHADSGQAVVRFGRNSVTGSFQLAECDGEAILRAYLFELLREPKHQYLYDILNRAKDQSLREITVVLSLKRVWHHSASGSKLRVYGRRIEIAYEEQITEVKVRLPFKFPLEATLRDGFGVLTAYPSKEDRQIIHRDEHELRALKESPAFKQPYRRLARSSE